MSSHHIVREKQEPALLILNPDDFSFEQLGQLLEWSPTVIATAETFPLLQASQVKVDWLVADQLPDSQQTHVRLIGPNVLVMLIQEGYQAVNIVDSTFSVKQSDLAKYRPFFDQLDLVIYTNDQKIYPVRSGFSKWKPAGDLIYVPDPPSGLSIQGLRTISPGIYQTVADGFFKLEFTVPVVLIAEEL